MYINSFTAKNSFIYLYSLNRISIYIQLKKILTFSFVVYTFFHSKYLWQTFLAMIGLSNRTKSIYNRKIKSIDKRSSSVSFWKNIKPTIKFFLVSGKIFNSKNLNIQRIHSQKPKLKFMSKSSELISKNLGKRMIGKHKNNMKPKITKSIHSKWLSTTNTKVQSLLIQTNTSLNHNHKINRMKTSRLRQRIQPS